jgi:enoyl-CoA hydratase/carnithine racemase
MDGFQGSPSLDHDRKPAPVFRSAVAAAPQASEGLVERRLTALETLVITKPAAGFSPACIESLRRIVKDVTAGRYGQLKFLVLDFAHAGANESVGASGFGALVHEVANLILWAPVVSIACVRADLIGADLELALACSMIVSEADRRFSFAADPVAALATYGFLSQKIGFVRAERLMERGEVIDSSQMHDLMLVKLVLESGAGLAGLEQFLVRTGKRYNACYGIYRAQRIAAPTFTAELNEVYSG